MFRSHTCGELNLAKAGNDVKLSGWVQRSRNKGGLIWVDLRDRFGITQLLFEEGKTEPSLMEVAKKLGREWVVQVEGEVIERISKNPNIPTGEIEVFVKNLNVLNESEVPPFTIEKETDGGEELRMKYRYLDLRREPVRENIILRHKTLQATRSILDESGFLEIETPFLIKSTPEGARDFVVPSRIHEGEFYALPQSPQTFKQLLMVSGFDKYFQIVKCFRDEDLRADRQPEFTQIDCEMAFVEREDILKTFEAMVKGIFKKVLNIDLPEFVRMDYKEAMGKYGSDKPDIRFGMELCNLNDEAKGNNFQVFDNAESIIGLALPGGADCSRKQIDALTDWVKRPQVGARGLVYVKYNADGTFKSSIDKFFGADHFQSWFQKAGGEKGDMLLILAGNEKETLSQAGVLRLELGDRLGLRNPDEFKPLWVIDFPMFEWDEESERYHAMHHPFTSPNMSEVEKLANDPASVSANAYDMVINGVEIGGGSIRIHDRDIQEKVFDILGFTKEEAEAQFGFLMNSFRYGAPPHGGIALGFDRLCAMLGGVDSIRDFIAFPKNNAGRDVMIDAPAKISSEQMDELSLALKPNEKKA